MNLAESTIVVPVCAGRRGHPVGFGGHFFPELALLGGDMGAKALLKRHAHELIEAPLDDPSVLRDVDRAGDLLAG